MKNVDVTFSEITSFLRFPLIILVLTIHSDVSKFYVTDGFSSNFVQFWRYWLTLGAVPAFFFISGYWFFVPDFNTDVYLTKLKNRIRTLLIPYLLWSTIAFVILTLKYLPQLESIFPNVHKIPYGFDLFWRSYISMPVVEGSITNYSPLNFPLWYLRDLMLLCLFSPLLYKILRYGWISLFVILIIWAMEFFASTSIHSIYPLFFFMWGGMLKLAPTPSYDFYIKGIGLFSFVIVYIFLCLFGAFNSDSRYIHFVSMILMVLFVPLAISISRILIINKIILPPLLIESTFFIYASHGLFIGELQNVLVKVLNMNVILPEFLLMFFTSLVAFAISFFSYCVTRKFLPKLLLIITGGR